MCLVMITNYVPRRSSGVALNDSVADMLAELRIDGLDDNAPVHRSWRAVAHTICEAYERGVAGGTIITLFGGRKEPGGASTT